MKALKEVIRKYALQNAIKFNGKANPESVIGKVLSENSKLNPKDVAKEVMVIIKEVNKLSKEKFQRAKPLNTLIPETSFSRPSGHATIDVVFFGLITYLFITKKHKLTATLISTLIILITGFTRLYLRVHWLTDVIAGLTLGTIILITSILIYKTYSSRFFKFTSIRGNGN